MVTTHAVLVIVAVVVDANTCRCHRSVLLFTSFFHFSMWCVRAILRQLSLVYKNSLFVVDQLDLV